MASQSLYRKWRSQTFADLHGQEAIVRTLLNAVRDERIAHAYLFCGPHGTGKTSAARLLAKALNCANPREGEPCNECVSCQEISAGRSPDVIEIDAASNNGVDSIRDLRENVNLLGSGGRYKVYIVDEAHMLSTQAWNAFLKTLEEPPPHIIFVFATTEAQKVLPTVVSRCQRFDFHRIRLPVIVARLKQVAEGEGLTLAPAAADLLARAAQGGLRDALSLLDQAVAYCGDEIDLERTRAMLGMADVGALRQLIACIADDQPAEALDLLNTLVMEGADLRQLNSQLADEWRALLLARAGADLTRVLEASESDARDLMALAQRFSLDELMACARVFARNEPAARGLPVPQLALELSLLDCAAARRHVAPAATTVAATVAPVAPTAPVAKATPTAALAAPRPPAAPSEQAPRELDTQNQPREPAASPPTAHKAKVEAPAEAKEAKVEAPPAEQIGEQPAGGADGERDLVAEALANWELIRKICRQKQPAGPLMNAWLGAARPFRLEPGTPPTLVIRTQFEAHLSKYRDADKRAIAEWALEQALGVQLRTHFVFIPDTAPDAAPARQDSPSASPAQATPRAQVYERGANGYGARGHAADAGRNGASPANGSATGSATGSANASASGAASQSASGRAERRAPAAGVTPSAAQPNQSDQLDQAARADPVVQELARALKLEVSEVRPLAKGVNDAGDRDNAGAADDDA